MRIKSMTATFGKLDHARLEPGPGKLRREGLVRDAAMAGTAGKEAKGISPQDVQAMLWKKSL